MAKRTAKVGFLTPPVDLTPTLAKHQASPLVQRRYYFLLPLHLLTGVVNAIGKAKFDDELLAMDFDLARAADDTTIVGLRYGQTVTYLWLTERSYVSRSLPTDLAAVKNWLSPQYHAALKNLDVPVDVAHGHARAYCGWLMSNPLFITEQRELLRQYRAKSKDHPLEWVATAGDLVRPGAARESMTLLKRWRPFCQRWRLLGMSAPGLPEPYVPLRSVDEGRLLPEHLRLVTYTVTSTGLFPEIDRYLIAQTAPSGDTSHLTEWRGIAALNNRRRRGSLNTLGRRFMLQHYWRVLHQRHPAACRRNTHSLEPAFAKFLGVTLGSVRDDLQFMRRQLGAKWYLA